jgi:uncharacterized repeat protein (TIGR03803 family)
MNDIVYGTTSSGGANNNAGAVFSLDPSTGVETVLHSFCSQTNCADGAEPRAGLIAAKDTLYGTTIVGGKITEVCSLGCGTAFSLDPSTCAEKVLYTFCSQTNCTDGENQFAGMTDLKGVLYGTTLNGGANGDGTVFALTKIAERAFDLSSPLHLSGPRRGHGPFSSVRRASA